MLRSFPLLLLLLPAVALAQTPEVVAKLDAKLDAERSVQRNEDVEILRRLLNKAAGLPNRAEVRPYREPPRSTTIADPNSLFGKSQSLPTDPMPFVGGTLHNHTTESAVGPFDGVYLPGAGVVFTLHVPVGVPLTSHGERVGLNSSCSTCHQPQVHAAHPISASTAHCTTCHTDVPKGEAVLSDWDRVKQDVRGDKSKPVEKPVGEKKGVAVCEPGNLQSLVGTVLAANAKHIRHLPEKEGVTVVVTFDEMKPVVAYTYRTYFDPVEKDADGKPVFKSVMLPQHADSSVGTILTNKPFSPEELKLLNLGDLHLKQGKHAEACDAYGKGLNRFWQKPFKVSAPVSLTATQKSQYADELQKGVRDAMKSYAKALLLTDQAERAKEALDMATGFTVLEVSPISTPASSSAPTKLILTVSKADIDNAKDATAFKKTVKVEWVNSPDQMKK